jgi:hypothetical protein
MRISKSTAVSIVYANDVYIQWIIEGPILILFDLIFMMINSSDNRVVHVSNDDDITTISSLILQKLQQKCSYIIVRNNDVLSNENDIMSFYNRINANLGSIQRVDKEKYSDEIDDYWVNVQYNSISIDSKPWKTNHNLALHTDNTLTNSTTFADITELVCIQPSTYSGETVFISNNKIIEIIKYMDNINNTTLYDDIMSTNVYHKNIQKPICSYNTNTNEYTFNFNITQILKSTLNDDNNVSIAMKFSNILDNIMNSSLVDEIRLNTGDAILFNDTIVMHGRRYIFGNRLYKKCSILLSTA